MKQFSRLLVVAGITTLSLAACKREHDDTPATPRYGSLQEARKLMETAAATADIDAVNGGSYRIGRCRVIVPASAFQTLSGTTVTGTVTLRFRDLLERSEMIFARVLPVSNGQPLVSGGEIELRAEQGGNTLRLRPGVALSIRIPQNGRDATGMQLFAGDIAEEAGNAPNIINWRPRRDQAPAGLVVDGDTVHLMTDSLGWCNADRFLSSPNYQSFTVTVSGATDFASGDLLGYASYDNYLGAWPMQSASGTVFNESHVPDIPVHFVIYGLKGGRLYAGIGAATPTTGSNYTVQLTEMTAQAFKAQVDALR